MSIRSAFVLVSVVLVAMLIGVLYVTYEIERNQQAITASETKHYESFKLADEMRQSSDDLTRMARMYVITGDPRFEEHFRAILAIRDGRSPRPANYDDVYWDFIVAGIDDSEPPGDPIALRTLMERMHFADEDFALLSESQRRSDALVALEDRAMAAVKGLFPDERGGYTRAGPADMELARALLHGGDYLRAKAEIMEPLREFTTAVERRTISEMESLRRKGQHLTRTALSLMGVILVTIGAAGVLLQRRVIRPVVDLANAANRVERGEYGERVEIAVGGEVGLLGRSFNRMSDAIDRDITEQQRSARELAEAREAAETANQTKSTFLANMSHELRTPMNAVLGYSEMLIEELGDEGLEQHVSDLEKIHAAGKHLLALINDVLDLSKIEAGRMDLYLETFDLREMLEQTVSTVATVVSKNGNDLVTELDNDLGQAHADATKLRQSILNLLSNAAKFTQDGTLTLRASRTAGDSGQSVIIEIRDTGIGIPPEKLEHIFEEFSQAEDHTARNFGGTGLGLAISRRFCRMMGGDITVQSEVGSGSTFTVTLPVNVSDVATTQPAVSEASVREPSVGAGASEHAVPGRTVLVIDDDPNARDLLQRAIGAEGLTVATAASADEGIRLAREIAPAVITLDVMMPEKDGWAVLRELKADPTLQEIPVIVVSILQEKGVGFALGAADYLTKPVDRAVLRRLVARHVGGRSNSAVLVVDDDPEARELVRRALESEHCAVSEAENGRAALERVAESRPDLIVLDLMMPVMGGIEFLRELRIDESGRDVPVIVLTAKLITAEEKRFLDEQVELVLSKEDAGIETMLEQIHAALPPRS